MKPERWQKVKGVLEQVLDVERDRRSLFLSDVCLGDDDLRDEVKSLLEIEDGNLEHFESSAYSTFFSRNSQPKTGDRIDRYEVIEELAVGGMGSVFLAKRVDGSFDQKVALKLIKAGMDSDSIVHRFFTERQILASLKHPNIAQLMDGGTTESGHPFFVMEYVEGSTIRDFVDNRDLGLNERLDLFCRVCSAVSYAHQNLVIHRDLKPSNILVTKAGEPKLLDFGIAKLLSSENESQSTTTQNIAFTPDYASPEQVLGEKLTTASDIYSLGVILYELLTGHRPYETDSRNFSKIIHAVCEVEPNAPSRTRRFTKDGKDDSNTASDHSIPASKLKGDLDNIVLKALRKEPDRRYSSVEQFSSDIRRFLNGLPVSASADTFYYRASKFIRRNRVKVAAATMLIVSLIVGLAATLYQARIARDERAKAEARFNDVRRLANSFVFEINDEIEKSPIKARSLLVQRAIEYLDGLNRESNGDASLQAELAAAYNKIGDVQAELFTSNLGNAVGSLESHQKALQLRQYLSDAEPGNIQRGLDLAVSRQKIGDILSMTGDIGHALENYQKAVDLSLKLAAKDGDSEEVQKLLAISYIRLGQSVLRSGSLKECLGHYEKSFEINRQLVLKYPNNLDYIRQQSVTYSYIGYVRILMGDFDRAITDLNNSLAIDLYISETDPKNMRFRRNVSSGYIWMGIGLRESGRVTESLPFIRKALALQQEIYDLDKQNFGELNSLADCHFELALAITKTGKIAAGIRLYQTAIKQYTAVSANDAADMAAYRQIFLAKRFMADAMLQSGKTNEALQNFHETATGFEKLTEKDANNLEWKFDQAICYSRMGKIMRLQNNQPAATETLLKALPILENLTLVSPQNINYVKELSELRALISHPPINIVAIK